MVAKNRLTFISPGRDVLIILAIALCPVLLDTFKTLLGIKEETHDFALPDLLMVCWFSLSNTAFLFYGCVWLVNFLNEKMPWNNFGSRRILAEFSGLFLYASITQIGIITAFYNMGLFFIPDLSFKTYFENIFFGNVITLIVISLVEGYYFFQRWRESLKREMGLKEAHAKSQLRSLQAQLDPHFMFNSLNVLSSLIQKDPDRAERFVEQFARVYRYVLEVKDEMVIPLKREVQFSEDYVALQQMRFGKGLEINQHIQAEDLVKYLPPLALQELLNNAIKHNELSAERPLVVSISSAQGKLVVENGLQLRSNREGGTHTGLENLRMRYALLGTEQPKFEMNHRVYRAELPLLNG